MHLHCIIVQHRQPMRSAQLFAFSAFIMCLTTFSACSPDEESAEDCIDTPDATWLDNGTSRSSNSNLHVHSETLMNLSFAACQSDNVDRTITISFLPYPPVVGIYEIRDGITINGTYAKGTYTTDDLGDFTTDDTHTGTISITEVNSTSQTLNATFQFTARKNNDAEQTVEITEGQIIGTNYTY